MTERSTYAWNLPANCGPLAAKLAAGGCTRIWVKAGVDNPGIRTVWPQWTDGRCEAFAAVGIEVCAWHYIYPESPAVQWDTIVRSLQARPSRDIALNAEVEWDNVSTSDVTAWVNGLRAALVVAGIKTERIGFSSVPSWDGGKGSIYHHFPYEAFCAACDFSMPQCYWSAPNEAEYERQRNTSGKPIIPILTACGEYDDAGLLAIARLTLDTLPAAAGFSSWECANGAYQFDAISEAYAMLPQDNLVTNTTAAAPSPIVTPAQNWGEGSAGVVIFRAETIVALNDGKRFLGLAVNGQPVPLDGTNPWKEL